MEREFIKAVPIWLQNQETEMHQRVQFKTVIGPAKDCELKIATSGVYQLWVNGKFIAYGPARAGKKHFCMDRILLSDYLTVEENTIVIEVVGYNVNSYMVQSQPSFLQAEIMGDGEIIAYTGKDFTARKNPYYYRKTERYSFQRPMIEAYNFAEVQDDFYINPKTQGGEVIGHSEPRKIIDRQVPYPLYETVVAEPLLYGETRRCVPEEYEVYEYCEGISDTLLGFPIDDLEIFPSKECQEYQFVPTGYYNENCCDEVKVEHDQYTVYKLPYNATGFVRFIVQCDKPITLYLTFDEILCNEQVKYLRMRCSNVIRFDLCAGTHKLQLFEVYTMQYLQFTPIGGACTVQAVEMVEYKHPPVRKHISQDTDLQKIMDAAVETYRQNAVDLFTDCPSRERAGWLCDSFFLGRTEFCLTGKNEVERSFLENFLHEENYEHLPEGVMPMCYPADHYNGNFILSWNMWLVLELKEYLSRTGDEQLIRTFETKIKKLFDYLSQYENEDGLLEHLPGWVFVEWSKANEFVQDVNYPTNMIYYAALLAAAQLYENEDYKTKAEHVKQVIVKQSFDGQFFTDHAVRKNGVLYNDGSRTEVCQYYAFFTGIANRNTHEKLFQYMRQEFGPEGHKLDDAVYPAAPFIGNYLRLEILMNEGYYQEVLDNIRGYFLYMAERTGTLWEYATENASCNHGFASCVIYWMTMMGEGTV